MSPGFWDDSERATSVLKEMKLNEYWVKMYEAVDAAVEDFAVLFEFWKEGEGAEEDVRAAYTKAIDAVEEAEFKSTLIIFQIALIKMFLNPFVAKKYFETFLVSTGNKFP